MATYLVLKRTVFGVEWVALPGELLIDPPEHEILMRRGFISPVPENYPGAVSSPPAVLLEQESVPQPTEADSPTTPEESDPRAELMTYSMAQLRDIAVEYKVEVPTSVRSRAALADLILAAAGYTTGELSGGVANEDDDEEEGTDEPNPATT